MKQLFLVSAGPGDSELITPKALKAIEVSSDVVGYGLYIDLLGDICRGKTLHQLPLGEEAGRARKALELAAEEKTTALISSGDIGIYAMATLVFELLDNVLAGRDNHANWLNVQIEVISGVSAMQANSSAAGALLGHDFCSISLSDLLTPWETIVKRIHSAGSGDFVVNFYNPASVKRNWQLDTARDILLDYRPATTPVVVGRNLTREDHQLRIIQLDQLHASEVDMFSCVCVGNSESRHIVNGPDDWVYTPRGYSKKL